MTAVVDFTVPGSIPESVVPAFDFLDSLEFVVKSCSEADLSDAAVSEAQLVDRIARLESLQHQVAALQSESVYVFARRHVASRIASGVVEPEKLERSIAGQVALACRVSPAEGRKRVRRACQDFCGSSGRLYPFRYGDGFRISSLSVTTIRGRAGRRR
ncbi:MAG: hypothetical protein L0I76_13150 [Pseudonocardia sp.]|nr:hypothetical protein [Actinomycetes bacterium]MDN5916033.1 hypothetical protein [Pseudonocardia sp.]